MKLIGLLESSWGGIITIRGYALLSDLVKISKVDDSYQRNLQKKHVKEISDFIKEGSYRFSPEIILGYRLKYDFNKKNSKSGYDPINILINGGLFISNVEKIRFSSKSIKSIDNVRLDFNIKVVTIDIKEDKIFSRIDGNHRLSAYEENKGNDIDLKVPFSIILFDNKDEGKKAERVIFNNINAKVIPLTSEENLKNILDGNLFSDQELKNIGDEYLFTKNINEKLNINVCSNIKHFFKNKERTILKELSIVLLKKGICKIEEYNKIIESINNINTYLKDNKDLFTNSSYSLFIAFVYFDLIDKFNIFYNWVIENHIYSLKNINYYDLIEIFKKVMEAKKKEIFLSMQFSPETKETYNEIKTVIEDINKDCKLKIKLREIRLDNFVKGYSYAINEEIYDLIEYSGFLIADLSFGNKNVYNELGFLMGLNKAKKRKNDNFLLVVDNRKGEANNYTGFNIKNLQCIRFKDMYNFKKELKKAIKKYYNLI